MGGWIKKVLKSFKGGDEKLSVNFNYNNMAWGK